jgi:D-glycero-alpha-D-manno-heptose-7-phosphate kinase
MIMTRTPLRLSFFGGGTDFRDFYANNEYGAVLSTTIDKFVYVTVKRHGALFDEPFRLNYSTTEMVNSIGEIQNEIGREALRMLGVGAPIYISTVADIPAGSGLGSSSAYAVGLLHALRSLQLTRTSFGDLAEMACHIEIDVLNKPIGKQDQYSAASGGLNYMRFLADESTSIAPISARATDPNSLLDSLQLFWTGKTRRADDILRQQKANIGATRHFLVQMRKMADDAATMLQGGRMTVATFGEMLDETWKLKRQLGPAVSNSMIDRWYERGCQAGAYGGKLCGAGGGGFLLFCGPKSRHQEIKAALPELREVPIRFEPSGSMTLYADGLGTHPNSRSGVVGTAGVGVEIAAS